ncbi:MAG: hypothetical protein HC884_10710 [Chloroflexaceae bacterium]|nr:hypothetical protein [Chloroflexaceae bacterium]
MNKRVLMAVGVLIVLLVSVVLVAPLAMAQGPGGGGHPGRSGQNGEFAGPPPGEAGGAPHGHLETIAETLGMTTEDLMSALQEGKTIAEVAEAQGVDLDTVVDAVLAEMKARLDTQVEAGRLTQDEADERLAEARERITERMNETRPSGEREGSAPPDRMSPPPHGGNLETIAETLGMTTEDLMSALQEGKTIAEVAETQGVDLDTVVDAVLTEVEARLDTQVEAGRLTQDEADERLAEARERITEQMNETRPSGEREGSAPPDRMSPPPHGGGNLETIAETLGMTTEDLLSALQEGKTIAEVAEAQGVDLDTVVDAVLAEVEARLDTQVEAGRLTQDEADERLTEARERITEQMSETGLPMGPMPRMPRTQGEGMFRP